MPKKRVRLEVWVLYDSRSGYVWPQVYEEDPKWSQEMLRMNYPKKHMKLVSEPYEYDSKDRTCSGSFGTEVEVPLK